MATLPLDLLHRFAASVATIRPKCSVCRTHVALA